MKTCGRILAILVFLAISGLPLAASSSADEGVYVSASGLYVIPMDSDVNSELMEDLDVEAITVDGFGGLGAVGYEFRPGIRTELEIGYRSFDTERLRVNDKNLDYKGDLSTWSVMANAYYAGKFWRLRPYVGAGIGVARHKCNLSSFLGTSLDEEFDDTALAYQFMGGLGVELTERLETRIGYRFFGTTAAEFAGDDMSYRTNNVEFGLLFKF